MRLYTSELVKKYKARTVVDHVSIDVNQGEIVGLLGPNGAGKTTTFYMIVGLIKPNEGRIFLENDEGQVAELTNEPVYKRAQMGVGYLAQEASVFRWPSPTAPTCSTKARYSKPAPPRSWLPTRWCARSIWASTSS